MGGLNDYPFGWRPCISKAPFSGRAFMYCAESPSRGRVITSRSAQHLPNFKILRHPLYLIPFLSAVWSLSIVPGTRAARAGGKGQLGLFLIEGWRRAKVAGGKSECWRKREAVSVPLIPPRDKLLISRLRWTIFVFILLNSFDPFFQFNNVLKHSTLQLDWDRFYSASRFKGDVRK